MLSDEQIAAIAARVEAVVGGSRIETEPGRDPMAEAQVFDFGGWVASCRSPEHAALFRNAYADIRALLAALQEAKQAPAPKPFRAGDHVRHRPSGESWVVAYQDGEYLAWCGWPEGEARAADCELIQAATGAEHEAILRRLVNAGGKRARKAQDQLARLFGGAS